jgi:alcohol dehydrogenase class IV
LPPAVTAATGFDALAQLLEALASRKANPLTDAVCREGLRYAAGALQMVYHHGGHIGARRDMALASLFSGIALANAGLGAVHGIAGPLGGMCEAPHGAVCAQLLPLVVRANVRALQAQAPDAPQLARYAEIARILTGLPTASIEDGIVWLEDAVQELQIPPLVRWGLKPASVESLAKQAQRSSSMQGNAIPLDTETLMDILIRAMGHEA